MSSKQTETLSLLGKELGQFLLIFALAFGLMRLLEHYWQDPLSMLAGSAGIMAAMLLVKRRLALVVTGLAAGVLGPMFTIHAVRAGALSFAAPHLEGVPAWLFTAWGAGGVFFGCLYGFLQVLFAQAETLRKHESPRQDDPHSTDDA
ncbi:hypothetical protein [Mangrovicoccus algicola]|uniref:Uncharacterized protein n=1 Tax=Mangrovicoccus algicola TaxID=2771008 RepID=A0A8J7CZ83_9RHOB|nr:hypothetical protein [Mangrovicoccus algicola]MBE3637498.1 hypothetical protein [Mangrovicoccus algicola]